MKYKLLIIEDNYSYFNDLLKEHFDCISYKFNYNEPIIELDKLDKYINENDIKFVLGDNINGFIILCLISNVKKICINTSLDIDNYNISNIKQYSYLKKWLISGNQTPWVNTIEDVVGIFTNNMLYSKFKTIYPKSHLVNNIDKNIREFIF